MVYWHSALGWLKDFDSGLLLLFSKPEFQVWGCMSVGLPAPPSVTAVAARKNCECGKAYDPA
eukprot:1754416-Rhodomonas_salina.1